MAYGQHETSLALCSVQWDNRYIDVPHFTTGTSQYNYFADKGSFFDIDDDFRFIDGACINAVVRVNARPERVQGYNYCIYNNNDSAGFDRVYCFITEAKSINYEVTELSLEVDLIQTYMFRYQLGYSTTERRMVTTDNRYHWGIPEQIENIANYVTSGGDMITREGSYPYICIREAITSLANISTPAFGTREYNRCNIHNGSVPYSFIICENDTEVAQIIMGHQTSPLQFNMENIISIGHISKAVVSLPHIILDNSVSVNRTIPRWIYQGSGVTYDEHNKYTLVSLNDFIGSMGLTTRFSKMTWLYCSPDTPQAHGTYTPKNKKLLSNEFSTLQIDNIGTSMGVNLDDFESSTIDFEAKLTYSDTFHLYMSPKNSGYRGANVSDYNKFIEIPIAYSMPMTTDDYYTWLNAHNVEIQTKKDNIALGTALGVISSLGSVALAGVTGGMSLAGLGVGVSAITQGQLSTRELNQELASVRSQDSFTERGAIGDNFLHLAGDLTSRWNYLQIDPRRVKVIDHFLSRNGYRMEAYEIPNIFVRQNWNYIKTRNCNILPQGGDSDTFMTNDIKLKIQAIYDTGIRFWNDPDYIGNYSHYEYNNPVITIEGKEEANECESK